MTPIIWLLDNKALHVIKSPNRQDFERYVNQLQCGDFVMTTGNMSKNPFLINIYIELGAHLQCKIGQFLSSGVSGMSGVGADSFSRFVPTGIPLMIHLNCQPDHSHSHRGQRHLHVGYTWLLAQSPKATMWVYLCRHLGSNAKETPVASIENIPWPVRSNLDLGTLSLPHSTQ